jgi:hypothetical protein
MQRLLVTVMVLLAWPALAQGQVPYDEIVQQFQAISFSNEFNRGKDAMDGRFDRWNPDGKPRVRVRGGRTEPVERVLADLRDITGLDIRLEGSGERPSIGVQLNTNECFARGGATRPMMVSIAADCERHCLLEELAQAIGPRNDSCKYRPSIFCNEALMQDYAPADRIILRATFDRRLRSGMTEAEAMPIVRVIIRELYDAWERGERF